MREKMQAVTVGSRVPESDFTGSIHSAFQTAANVMVDGLEILLALYISDNTDLPQGVRLPRHAAALLSELRAGQQIFCRSGVLRAPGRNLLVDLNGAPRYDGSVGGACAGPAASEEQGVARGLAWRAALGALAARQEEKNADLRVANILRLGDREKTAWTASTAAPKTAATSEPLSGGRIAGMHAEERARQLAFAARQTAAADLDGLARGLVGLGGGLTPTGDDFLVGFLAGLHAAPKGSGQSSCRVEWLKALSESVRAASSGTGDISRTYLLLAADGQFSSSLAALAGVICAGARVEVVRSSAEIVFQTGHTSGMDAASGLLTAFAAWNPDWI
jgi:hypothetical protein